MYLDLAVALNALVDFLLLMGVSRFFPSGLRVIRAMIAPIICALYAVLTLYMWLPTSFASVVSVVLIILTGMIAFGWNQDGFRSCTLYLLLRVAIAGVLRPEWILRPWPLLAASVLVLLLCALGLPEGSGYLVPVELCYGTNRMALTALRDTGNTLRDPVTGKPILILGADAAQNLTGLTIQQLQCPVETMGAIPGLRLIPYHAISGGGLLLALQLPMVRIGSRRSSALVAFAPEILSREGKFQALTGGVL